MELELDPAQPPEVTRLVALLLEGAAPPVDPWWQAGLDEALGAAAAVASEPPRARPRVPLR